MYGTKIILLHRYCLYRAEESYEDNVIITESPRVTGTEPLSITVTGVGTSNENILF